MINVPVDEAYAFDMLAIVLVKIEQVEVCDDRTFKYYHDLAGAIIKQLGASKYQEIIDSEENEALVDANYKVFKAVDLAKENKISAKEVDDLNYLRYICKGALQKKFFGTELNEKKVNYES